MESRAPRLFFLRTLDNGFLNLYIPLHRFKKSHAPVIQIKIGKHKIGIVGFEKRLKDVVE